MQTVQTEKWAASQKAHPARCHEAENCLFRMSKVFGIAFPPDHQADRPRGSVDPDDTISLRYEAMRALKTTLSDGKTAHGQRKK